MAKMTKQELEKITEFILANKDYFTTTEMADFLNMSFNRLDYILKKLGVECISVTQRNRNYILRHQHLSIEQLAIKLDLTETQVARVLRDMGFNTKYRHLPVNPDFTLHLPEAPKTPAEPDKTAHAALKSFLEGSDKAIKLEDMIYLKEPNYLSF